MGREQTRYTALRVARVRTAVACHEPPRAVRMPRAFDASTMERKPVTLAASICRMIGNTFAAKAPAAPRLVSAPRDAEHHHGRQQPDGASQPEPTPLPRAPIQITSSTIETVIGSRPAGGVPYCSNFALMRFSNENTRSQCSCVISLRSTTTISCSDLPVRYPSPAISAHCL